MSKKDKQILKSQFEYECYLRNKPYYLMMKYGFYIAKCFAVITYIYGFVCICMEFVLHILIVKEFIILILLSVIIISTIMFTVGNVVFEIEFKKHLKT